MAVSITGRSSITAFAIPATSTDQTWGTALGTTAANDEILHIDLGPLVNPRDDIPDPSAGYQWHEYVDLGRENVGPDITMLLRYSGRQWSMISQLMGDDAISGGSDPYTHLFTLLDQIDCNNLWGTLANQTGASGNEKIREWTSIKPIGFTIEGPDGDGYMTLTIRTIANTCKLGADATWDPTAFGNVTHISLNSALPPPVPFGAVEFKMNARTGGDVTSEIAIPIQSISLTFDRGLGPEHISRASQTEEWQSAEPIEDGIPEQMLTIVLADHNVLTYFEAFQDEIEYKARLFWSLDANHDIKIEIPCMKFITPDANISGPARIPETLNFRLMKALANPTGMAFTNWRITLRDAHDTAYVF